MAGRKRSILGVEQKSELTYCTRCQKNKPPSEFFKATDMKLDASGLMHICKSCCDEIYNGYFETEHSVDKALYQFCKRLNISYMQSAVDAVKTTISKSIEDKKELVNIIGVYRRVLGSHSRGTPEQGNDLLFIEPDRPIVATMMPADQEQADMLQTLGKFWGSGFALEDYDFLEEQLSEWKQSHRCDTKAELELLKQICFKQLDIQRARQKSEKTASLVKELQELMKTASLDPSKANLGQSGKSQDSFSGFIKMIEETEPAEFYEDKELFSEFKDNKDLEYYFNKFIRRPLKNFVTQSRDFSLEVVDEDEDDGDSLIELATDTEAS